MNHTSTKYLTFEDIQAYEIAFQVSNQIWDIALRWNYFAKDTIGK